MWLRGGERGEMARLWLYTVSRKNKSTNIILHHERDTIQQMLFFWWGLSEGLSLRGRPSSSNERLDNAWFILPTWPTVIGWPDQDIPANRQKVTVLPVLQCGRQWPKISLDSLCLFFILCVYNLFYVWFCFRCVPAGAGVHQVGQPPCQVPGSHHQICQRGWPHHQTSRRRRVCSRNVGHCKSNKKMVYNWWLLLLSLH